jgi:Calcineurin-like phosphoesterase
MPTSFITARNPILSLFQSAAAAVARRVAEEGIDPTEHPLSAAAAHVVAARSDPTRAYAPPAHVAVPSLDCAQLGLALLEAMVAGDADRQRALHDRLSFSQCDPLWAETLVDYAGTLRVDGQPRPIPYVRYTSIGDFVRSAPRADMRVALISDWGTGTDQAREVARLIARQQPDLVIHLGDIYYAGTAEECDAHFLTPMRAALPDVPLLTLCGNHDVYSGGDGYYGLLNRLGQPASYFCLRSPDNAWQILAGDTGLHDRDPFDEAAALTQFDPAEELWHADKLRGFPGRTVFLTHHQPFSAFAQIGPLAQHDPVNPNLMASHARLAAAGWIDAWFWGHEHRLKLYAPYRGVVAGRNIGYGAIPVEATPGPDAPLPGLVDPPQILTEVTLDVVDGAHTHGFALLDFRTGGIDASYWAITRPAGPIHSESLGQRDDVPIS